MTKKHVAVVGAGYAGLASCWFLLQHPDCLVTLIEAKELGAGASKVSAGLLHPFTGPEAKLAWHGLEGFHATLELLSIAEKALGHKVASRNGILRVALGQEQTQSFFERSQQYPFLRWLSSEQVQQIAPSLACAPALLIPNGIVVNPEAYLSGLWKACADRGAEWQTQDIRHLSELAQFDQVVLATGSLTSGLIECAHLPIQLIKGQIVELAWNADLPALSMPINSDVYLIPSPDQRTCLVGATFERSYEHPDPDSTIAEAYLRPKVERLIPSLKNAKLISCRAGIRATTASKQPLITRLNEKVWLFIGLGSKGLLHHAYLASRLANEMAP